MPSISTSTLILSFAVLLLLAKPAHAFGAGNIASVSKIEGLNWRHGDIEDTLLTLVMSRAAGGKKFDKMNVARVYFGNWLRDYSQAIDVGTVKYVSAEAIRILLWVLGFMTFGFGTKEFEVTAERLGCYRPEDHIDNPKDYADNLDATQYDRRLRGPVNERVELAIDPNTGLKNYIANEHAGCMTSALHVRQLFGKSIQLGRSYNRSKNKDELYESLRLLGTALHCLEDYSAHSNYVELALIEMGEQSVFPHVGQDTQIRLQGARGGVFPIVTGTFGGVDFLHSVMGEVSDKATQSEIQELEGTIQSSGRADTSALKDLLNAIPKGLFGNTDEASKVDEVEANATAASMNQMRVSPRQPEQFTRQMQQVSREIMPIIAWHDEIMLGITEAIEKIPILPDLLEKLQEQLSIFVFSLIAPFVLPIITQIKTELETGSSEVIQSSKAQQLNVFHDGRSTDPTHSMLSKDHFSNILNEPAGKIASQVLKWVVPQIVECWDNERADVDRTINRIIGGVFHHPAQRQMGEDGASDGRQQMFRVVEQWWGEQGQREQQSLRRQLSRDGVMNGENHKPGVHDKGHGCGKPLGLPKASFGGSGNAGGALMSGLSSAIGGSSGGNFGSSGSGMQSGISNFASEAAGGGALGGLVGALAGGIGGSLLSGAFGGGDEEKKAKKSSYSNEGYNQDGGYQQTQTEYGHSGNTYAQAQYSQTQRPDGGYQTDFQRYEQGGHGQAAGFEQHTETRPTYGGGYEQSTERRYEREGGEVRTEKFKDTYDSHGRESHSESKHSKHKDKYNSKSDSEDDDDGSDDEKRRHKKEKKKREKEQKYGRHDSGSDDDKPKHHGGSSGGHGGHGERRVEHGSSGGYGERREEHGSSRNEYGGSGNYSERREERREEYGSRQEYGGGRQEYGGGGQEYGGGRQEYGGGRQESGGGGQEYGSSRNEYGGGNQGYGGGYEQPSRNEYNQGGGDNYGGGEYGERRQDEYQRDDRDEYSRDDRREGGGGGGGGWGY